MARRLLPALVLIAVTITLSTALEFWDGTLRTTTANAQGPATATTTTVPTMTPGSPTTLPTTAASPTTPASPTVASPTITTTPVATTIASPTVTPIGNTADLVVSVFPVPNPAIAGEILTYFVTVSNQGQSASAATTIVGQIPNGTVLASLDGCTQGGIFGPQNCFNGNFGNSCVQNPITGAVTCNGTPSSGCIQNPITGEVTCDGMGTSPCFQNPVTGVVDCSGTNFASGCHQTFNAVECPVPSLPAGAATTFAMAFQVTTVNGTIFESFVVDPGNQVPEANQTNNIANVALPVVPGDVAFPLPPLAEAPPPPPPTEVPAPAPPDLGQPVPPTPVPAPPIAQPVTPVNPPVSTAPQTQADQWLHVLQPTEAFSVTMDPAWTAQAGEWYRVREQEGGWALAIYERDTDDWQEWIQLDPRVEVLNTVHIPQPVLFAVMQAPTQVYSVNMDPLWVAQPGERYEVVQEDNDWVLGIWEHDPAEWQEWIQIDEGVALLAMN